MCVCVDEQMSERRGEQTDEQTNKQTSKMDRRMDERVGEWRVGMGRMRESEDRERRLEGVEWNM